MAGISTTTDCNAIPSTGCLTCANDGGGSLWQCANDGAATIDVAVNVFACTP
jgi:hypothetical protein